MFMTHPSVQALPHLPYADTALDPVISSRTIGFHYGKHHQAYLKNLQALIQQSPLAEASLEEIVVASARDGQTAIFNNAAQVWNHSFYWNSLSPKGGGTPTGRLAGLIADSFGDLASLKDVWSKVALGQFGSGWAWLVQDGASLKVCGSAGADTPLVHGQIPLLTIDVWEHAYYLDYQNLRADYVKSVLERLVNWDFAAANLR
jgi:Fe-Mn family superoxide dismutase